MKIGDIIEITDLRNGNKMLSKITAALLTESGIVYGSLEGGVLFTESGKQVLEPKSNSVAVYCCKVVESAKDIDLPIASGWSINGKTVSMDEMMSLFKTMVGFTTTFEQYNSKFRGKVIASDDECLTITLIKDTDKHPTLYGRITYDSIMDINSRTKKFTIYDNVIVTMSRIEQNDNKRIK